MHVVRTEPSQKKVAKLMKAHHHKQPLEFLVNRLTYRWLVKRLICHSIIGILWLFMIKYSVYGHLNVPFWLEYSFITISSKTNEFPLPCWRFNPCLDLSNCGLLLSCSQPTRWRTNSNIGANLGTWAVITWLNMAGNLWLPCVSSISLCMMHQGVFFEACCDWALNMATGGE